MKQTSIAEFENDGVGDALADATKESWRRRDGEGGDAPLTVDTNKVATLIREVKHAEVVFDYADVLIDGVDEVLEKCGVCTVLNEAEQALVHEELRKLGESTQTREMVRFAESGDELLESLPFRVWSARDEELFSKVELGALRKARERHGRNDGREEAVAS